jgi:hypothetical protein
MKCTHAMAIRQGLAKSWKLPCENDLRCTGDDWVLILLDKLNKDMRDKLMFIWWRAWHHRNNIIFSEGKVSFKNSISFLQNFLATSQNLKKGDIVVDRKGKSKIDQPPNLKVISPNMEKHEAKTCEKPPNGWIKCMLMPVSWWTTRRVAGGRSFEIISEILFYPLGESYKTANVRKWEKLLHA